MKQITEQPKLLQSICPECKRIFWGRTQLEADRIRKMHNCPKVPQ